MHYGHTGNFDELTADSEQNIPHINFELVLLRYQHFGS